MNKYNTISMLAGYYDEKGKYSEVTCKNYKLKKLGKSITRNIDLQHDITIQVVPGVEVRVFAKSLKDIKACLEITGDSYYFKSMLDSFSVYHKSDNGEYIYTSYDLEELREDFGKEKEIAPIVF